MGKHSRKTKTMWGNILTIQCFLKKNYQQRSFKKKVMWRNIVVIYNALKEKKTTELNFQLVQY